MSWSKSAPARLWEATIREGYWALAELELPPLDAPAAGTGWSWLSRGWLSELWRLGASSRGLEGLGRAQRRENCWLLGRDLRGPHPPGPKTAEQCLKLGTARPRQVKGAHQHWQLLPLEQARLATRLCELCSGDHGDSDISAKQSAGRTVQAAWAGPKAAKYANLEASSAGTEARLETKVRVAGLG